MKEHIDSRPNFDIAALSKLGDLVYRGGGKELIAIVEDIRSGKAISL